MKELIDKYLNDSIDGVEREKLRIWLEKEKNQTKFKAILESHYYINLGLQEVDLKKEYSLLLNKLEGHSLNKRRSNSVWYQRAAVLIGMLGLGYIMYITIGNSDETYIDQNAITIKQENGKIQVIKEDGSLEIVNSAGKVIGKQNGGQLDYKNVKERDSANPLNQTLTYNELVVPYGKKIKLVLSDGTLVHINSGTSFKYPVKFLKDSDRKVFLNGEAFFEVTKSKTSPFIVNTDEIDIRVLGTKFNLSAYQDDEAASAVLVEGSVEVYKVGELGEDNNKFLLFPGHIATWNKSKNSMEIAIIDVNEYTSWINGQIIFKVRPFPEILKVLERHYNVSITNNYNFLDSQRFFAKFDTETIEQVMTYFQSSIPFTFTRVGDEIIINKP